MRTQLEGYKGNLRKFYAPVSESKFNADKLQFTDTSGSNLPYRMNNIDGEPTIKHDVLSMGAMIDFSRERVREFGYSDISTSTSEYQEFDFSGLFSVSKYVPRLGSFKLTINQIEQFNIPPWSSATGTDYYFADSYKKVRVRKQVMDSGIVRGITLQSGDQIVFRYKIQPRDLD